VQFKLLQFGIESAHLTTDSGIDLVAYAGTSKLAKTIQVKTNLKTKPAGGKGAPALDWWFPEASPADMIALVDVSEARVWLFPFDVAASLAQQSSNGNYHLYMYIDPSAKVRGEKLAHVHRFEEYLLERSVETVFAADAASHPERKLTQELEQLL
jgi:hypothetical protein